MAPEPFHGYHYRFYEQETEAFLLFRNLYDVDENTLLFVTTDRISAYDVVMNNAVPYKGAILTVYLTIAAIFFQSTLLMCRSSK